MVDSDPTVSCFDNVYQSKCKYEVPEDVLNNPIERIQCVDYYNKTDNRFVWWQKLQNESTFIPKRFVYVTNDLVINDCLFEYTNFFLYYYGYYGAVHVDVDRGYHLQSTVSQRDTVYICVLVNTPPDMQRVREAVKTFLYCLVNYGAGITIV